MPSCTKMYLSEQLKTDFRLRPWKKSYVSFFDLFSHYLFGFWRCRIILDTYSELRGRMTDWIFFWDNMFKEQPRQTILDCGKTSGTPDNTDDCASEEMLDFGIRLDTDLGEQENRSNSKNCIVAFFTMITKLEEMYFFFVTTTFFIQFFSFETTWRFWTFWIILDISAMGGGAPGDLSLHLSRFELYETTTFQNFWTERNRVIIRGDPASFRA